MKYRRFVFYSTLLLCIISSSFTEARLVLAPKKKMTKKQRRAETATKLAKQRQDKMQGTTEEPTVKLEATITKNENGEHILQLTKESSEALQSSVQKSKQSNALKAVMVEEPAKQQVLFYDPKELKTAPGEPPLPKKVYDVDGNEVDMTGKEAILIPPPVAKEKEEEAVPKQSSQEQTKNKYGSTLSLGSTEERVLASPQRQDQFIIVSTVATMALLVGAVSARRLRSKQFLNFCIENESLEDELAYDAAYTTQSTVGASSFYSGAGYDTFANGRFGGDLRWRGDLEKFDV
jgi:hypothetical protein